MTKGRSPRPRLEGFPSQHLVVLPEPVVRSNAAHPLLAELQVTDAGFFPQARGHCVERHEGTATTLVILCVAGQGWVRLAQGSARTITAGDLVWLPAKKAHAYGADNNSTPWSILWMHLSGIQTEAWRLHLDHPPEGGVRSLNAAGSAAVARAIEEIYGVLELGITRWHAITAASWARLAICQAAQIHSASLKADSPAERAAATMDWMKAHLDRRVRLSELAALAGISVPHYSALFRKTTGYAPIDYFIRLRIQHAAHLLDGGNLSITQVASAIGFEDPYYFSRMFRSIMGLSPSHYCRLPKG